MILLSTLHSTLTFTHFSYTRLYLVWRGLLSPCLSLLLMSTSWVIQSIINLMPFIIRPIYTIFSGACSYYIYSKTHTHVDALIKITQSGLLIFMKYNAIPQEKIERKNIAVRASQRKLNCSAFPIIYFVPYNLKGQC